MSFDGVSDHQPHDRLLNRIFRRRSKKTSKFRVTGLCAGNSPVTGEFPAQMASNGENVSIWWRHHVEKVEATSMKYHSEKYYRQVSNIRRTKFQQLKDYRTVLRLSLPNPLRPDVKSRMKM